MTVIMLIKGQASEYIFCHVTHLASLNDFCGRLSLMDFFLSTFELIKSSIIDFFLASLEDFFLIGDGEGISPGLSCCYFNVSTS